MPVTDGGLLNILPPPLPGKTAWPWTEQIDPERYNSRPNWPKLTIVSPSYNQGDFLEETIRSVLLQNYPNLEYIVMDGGSTDGTKEILEKYAPWISYQQSRRDNGQSQAINMGFSLASGDYYAWINSDDYYLKDIFHLVVSKFLSSGVDFVYGYVVDFNVAQNKSTLIKVPPFPDYFIKIPTLAQSSCFWSKSIHQPLWEELHCALDYELWLRLVKGNKRARIKQPLSVAQVHGEAKTSDPKMKAQWHQDHLKIWSAEGHGPVPEWSRVVFLNKIRMKFLRLFNII
ncbi:glycosyltransferase family 2 protein [Mucilaginibacter sp.]|uniref:glycosyltransferase family 2 protein n=1 Tax=Mucilaginibacter sp. TaxID=1882438 RepID=UPI0032638BA2